MKITHINKLTSFIIAVMLTFFCVGGYGYKMEGRARLAGPHLSLIGFMMEQNHCLNQV